MKKPCPFEKFDPPMMKIALNEIFPNATYGSISVADRYDALKAFFGIDAGAAGEASGYRTPRKGFRRQAG